MAAVLIVEDDPALVELMRHLLEEAGHSVLEAGSLAEAEAPLRGQRVDLIVADLVDYEQFGGRGAIRALRELAGGRPILLCTGQPGADELCTEEGVAGLIQKPFDVDLFLAAVNEALKVARSGGED